MSMVKTLTNLESFRIIEQKLKKPEKVFFIRYGDGEFVAMEGRQHRNYRPSEGLSRELLECFKIHDPNFLIGLAANYQKEYLMSRSFFAPYPQNQEILDFIESKKLHHNTNYLNPFLFTYLSIVKPHMMYGFFEKYIRPKRKMFIGGTSKESAEKLYGPIDYFIPVPFKHAYDSISDWWPQVEENVQNVELILPSAGAASAVIAKRLWSHRHQFQLLDIGSLIDAVEGLETRTWIRLQGHHINKILPQKEQVNFSFKQKVKHLLKDIKVFFRQFIVN